jgi:diguanylate cyclase (GGDEF)-like protein
MLGHQAGDDVLRAVVNVMADNLRRSDTVARLGGDEFALILPETEAQAAELVVVKLRYQLLDTMRARGWPITFSIGLLSCGDVVPDDQELIKRVDQLMYAVKRDGRDNVQFASAA